MSMTDRRTLLQTAVALPLAAASANTALAQPPDAAAAASPKPTPPVTRELAHYIITASYDDLPPMSARKAYARY